MLVELVTQTLQQRFSTAASGAVHSNSAGLFHDHIALMNKIQRQGGLTAGVSALKQSVISITNNPPTDATLARSRGFGVRGGDFVTCSGHTLCSRPGSIVGDDMSERRPVARPPSSFTKVRRVADRAVYEREAIYQVLDVATCATVAHAIGTRPVATPTLHWRIGDRVYWHGSVASRMLKSHAEPSEVCLTARVFDGWVLARSAFNHTVNYRSVLCFGRPELVEGVAEKTEVLKVFMEHWFPGRWGRLRPVNKKELAATSIYSIPLNEASAKIRDGGPDDPAKDLDWPVWAGVVPVSERIGRPIADTGIPASAAVPPMPRLRARAKARKSKP